MSNFNVSADDPNFGTTLGTYMLMYKFFGTGWTINHTRDMVIELNNKVDSLLNPRVGQRKIAGRRRYERSDTETRWTTGSKVRNPRGFQKSYR